MYRRTTEIPCLHGGLSADYTEIVWNEQYLVPNDTLAADVRDYPLARNPIQFVVALSSEVVVRSLTTKTCYKNLNFFLHKT